MAIKSRALVLVLRQQVSRETKYSMTQDSIFKNNTNIIYVLLFEKIFLQDDAKKIFFFIYLSTRRCRAFFSKSHRLEEIVFIHLFIYVCVYLP